MMTVDIILGSIFFESEFARPKRQHGLANLWWTVINPHLKLTRGASIDSPIETSIDWREAMSIDTCDSRSIDAFLIMTCACSESLVLVIDNPENDSGTVIVTVGFYNIMQASHIGIHTIIILITWIVILSLTPSPYLLNTQINHLSNCLAHQF